LDRLNRARNEGNMHAAMVAWANKYAQPMALRPRCDMSVKASAIRSEPVIAWIAASFQTF
jgi:hypothetical protein